MFAVLLLPVLVIVFFNSALVGAAMIRLRRRRSDAGRRFRRGQGAPRPRSSVMPRSPRPSAWCCKRLKDDDNFLVRLLGSGLGAAWTLATFLVVPVLVSQNVGADRRAQAAACAAQAHLGRERDRQCRHRHGVRPDHVRRDRGRPAVRLRRRAWSRWSWRSWSGLVFVGVVLLLGVYQSGAERRSIRRRCIAMPPSGEAPAASRRCGWNCVQPK